MSLQFPTDYKSILSVIDRIDPISYGKTRNYVNGDVTYLSPYISRGVIGTKQVLSHVCAKGYKLYQIESFVKELCWRDYFQRIAQVRNINEDIKQAQTQVANYAIPKAIVNAQTGIEGIDTALHSLYKNGYMHNHTRMYTAALACNIAKSHWYHPAKWLYYNLLDGDWASNAGSWQWVAGTKSAKKYIANQENINKYTHTQQEHTFLDTSYEALADIDIPTHLTDTILLDLKTSLPQSDMQYINPLLPTFIYNYYNLDPCWHANETSNRILLLEPAFFEAYPISSKCVDFMFALAQQIDEISIYVGTFQSLCDEFQLQTIYYKEHPLNIGYKGIEEPRDWICKEIEGYYPSFFAYWKKVSKMMSKLNLEAS
jgi:deoxyribodipyrimidine photo-lyase